LVKIFRKPRYENTGKNFENPCIEGHRMEIVRTFSGNTVEWILIIHNNGIFPYYRYSIEIVWIYYGFSGAIANLRVWISLFFPSEKL
jgi:hypothetical protein